MTTKGTLSDEDVPSAVLQGAVLPSTVFMIMISDRREKKQLLSDVLHMKPKSIK